MIYGGTLVLDASGAGEDDEDGALALVTAVGGASMRANLIRLVSAGSARADSSYSTSTGMQIGHPPAVHFLAVVPKTV